MRDSGPIGVFDSGIGGLTIARKIRELMPGEDILYVADTGHAPYGDRPDRYILDRSFAVTDFLLSRQVKVVVVACNTATTTCISELRAKYPVPFIGVEPGVKPAVLNSKSGVVGILATSKTLVTDSFAALAKRVSGDIRVEVMPCPELVVLIESLKLSYEETAGLVGKYVHPLLARGADTIVLGCTHYAHLAPVIARVAGPDVSIISTELAVANEVCRRLESQGLTATNSTTGGEEFWSSGELALFQAQVQHFWGPSSLVRQF